MSQHGAYALHAGLVRLNARMRMHAHAPGKPHARTNTNQYVIIIVFLRQKRFANGFHCYAI
jgi:hypothetical protein